MGSYQYPAITPKENPTRASSKFFGGKKKKGKNSSTIVAAAVAEKEKKSRAGSPGPSSANSSRSHTPKHSPRSDGTKGKNRSFTTNTITASTTTPSLTPDIPPVPAPVGVTSNAKLANMKEDEMRQRIKYLESQVRGVETKYQTTINVMQMKLHDARKKNTELEGQVQDLRKENGNLRKSKIDLMTWANTEIAALKKKCGDLKSKMKSIQRGADEGATSG